MAFQHDSSFFMDELEQIGAKSWPGISIFKNYMARPVIFLIAIE